MDNSIALDPERFYKYSKNPYIRSKILRTMSLKFHNSFRVKLFMYGKTYQKRNGMVVLEFEVSTEHCLIKLPLIHGGQIVLLHYCRTFASLIGCKINDALIPKMNS